MKELEAITLLQATVGLQGWGINRPNASLPLFYGLCKGHQHHKSDQPNPVLTVESDVNIRSRSVPISTDVKSKFWIRTDYIATSSLRAKDLCITKNV